MRAEVNLLRSIARPKRNVADRASAKTEEHIRISRQYGQEYFDGSRDYGYGGYRYDGRWKQVALDIIEHFSLSPGDRVLDVGAAKGFLVHDMLTEGLDAYGLDISEYALMNCDPNVIGRLHLGNAVGLPFPDGCFKCVISLDTIHNLSRDLVKVALSEIQRVSNGNAFVKVDSYRTPDQKRIFESWVLTAQFHDYPDGWLRLFDEAGYTGDYWWTIID